MYSYGVSVMMLMALVRVRKTRRTSPRTAVPVSVSASASVSVSVLLGDCTLLTRMGRLLFDWGVQRRPGANQFQSKGHKQVDKGQTLYLMDSEVVCGMDPSHVW